jgi:uncharacterized protein (TIGR02001 family)
MAKTLFSKGWHASCYATCTAANGPGHTTHSEDTHMGRSRYLLVALALGASQPAIAGDFSANVGMMSDYIFRGIKQNTSASAFAGLDYEASGFYVGTWAAEVGEGIEYDLYTGYGGTVGDFSYGIGYTGYFYTDDFDDTYHELNLSAGYGLFSIEYAAGRYDNFDGPTLDYGFLAGTVEYEGFYLTYGTFSRDADGDYVEVGYGAEVSGFDLGIAAVHSDSTLSGTGSSETALVFTIGKTFNLR